MAAEGARSSATSSADSYIGSLISLTSKSEIRYEGVLYSINTEESSIGLRNVRSYGSEGRKKDGPQVPAGDKVYEYILFRGSDIKDLQVKSSPVQPVQPTPPINNDPAIIQSHYAQPSSTLTTFPPTITGPLAGTDPITTQMGLPGSNFQGGLPLYHPGGSLGSWGPSPAPHGANANGLAMPMYYQGFYGPSNGLPQLHQQSVFRPPPGLSMPPSMQQPMQYPGFNTSLSTGASNFLQSNLPELPPSLQTLGTSSVNLTATSILPSTLPLSGPTMPSSTPAPETFPNFMQNKASISAPVTAPLFQLSSLATSGPDVNVVVPQIPNSVKANSGPNMSYQPMSQSVSSFLEISNSSISEAPTPSLVTPGQLLKSEPTPVPSSQPLQADQKDVEVVKVSSTPEPSAPVSTEAQPPILPLPTPSRAAPKVNGTPSPTRQGYRGSESHGYRGSESHGYRVSENHGYRGGERGRGRGSGMMGSRPAVKFTEEFDFKAMNEKFNKDEVWGDLGKNNRSNSKDKDGDGNLSDENDYQEDDASHSPVKPVYNKDDFFDTISCNALDRESNNGRTKFSEQMKIDTETFGEFSRYRGGRGGRGLNRGGGRPRGGYYGRGYGGYSSRGRGRGYSNQAIN